MTKNKKAFVSFIRRDESLYFRGTTLLGNCVPAFGIGTVCANPASLVTVRKPVSA